VHFLSFSFLVQAAADWAVERLSALRSHAHP
jgi:hypothetical protein